MEIDKDMMRLRAINEAIWIRDHSKNLSRSDLFRVIEDISEYNVFSSRQIALMTGKIISHQTISKLNNKEDKTGGSLNVLDLEKIRDLFYGKSNGSVNYRLAKEIIENGTSQGMLEKLTGIHQSSISKKIKELK
jgi:hypothetical protein